MNTKYLIPILHLGNLACISFIISEFTQTPKLNLAVVVGGLAIYYGLLFFLKNKWLPTLYYGAFSLIEAITLLTAFLGIPFALIGGLKLTLLIVSGYLLVGILFVLNIRQIYFLHRKNNFKNNVL